MPKKHRSVSGEAEFSFNREAKADSYYALTKMVSINAYKIDINDHLYPELKYCQGLTSQGTLGPSISMRRKMKLRKRV